MGIKHIIAWIVQGTESVYGVGRAQVSLAQAIRERGHDVLFIAITEGAYRKICEEKGIQYICLNKPALGAYDASSYLGKIRQYFKTRRQEIGYAKSISEKIQDYNINFLHTLWGNFVSLIGRSTEQNSAHAIWEMSDLVGKGKGFSPNCIFYQLLCFRYNVTVLQNSHFTGNTLNRWPVSAKPFSPAVDAERFLKAQTDLTCLQKNNIPADSITIGSVARICEDKAQHLLIEAVGKLVQDGLNVHVLILGGDLEGKYYDRLQTLVSRYDLNARVHFLGAVPNPEAYYPLMDIHVNLRTYPEPFGISVIEGMLCGKPAFVYALGGPAETVIDNVTGWHIHTPTVDGCYEGFKRAIADRHRWLQMGMDAKAHAVENYTAAKVAKQYECYLEEISN